MTNFNTDYNNTELLDQELSFDELQEINGGVAPLAAAAWALGAYVAGQITGRIVKS
jgi:lactobin A/cerein 7B family class IIb bacteriocin